MFEVGGNTCNNAFELATLQCCVASCSKSLLVLLSAWTKAKNIALKKKWISLGILRFNIYRTRLRHENKSVNFGALQVKQVCLSLPTFFQSLARLNTQVPNWRVGFDPCLWWLVGCIITTIKQFLYRFFSSMLILNRNSSRWSPRGTFWRSWNIQSCIQHHRIDVILCVWFNIHGNKTILYQII